MMDLYSLFDPSTSFNLSLNWMSFTIPLLSIPSMF